MKGLAIALLVFASAPQDAPSEAALRAAREATAVLRSQGKVLGVATLFRREPGRAFLITSSGVLSSKAPTSGLEAIFYCGTAQERIVPATIHSEVPTLSLILLKVEAADLPAPIPPASGAEMTSVPAAMSTPIFGTADPTTLPAGAKPEVAPRTGKVREGAGGSEEYGRWILTVGESRGVLGGPALYSSGRLFGICVSADANGVTIENPWALDEWILGKIVEWKPRILENREGTIKVGVSATVSEGWGNVRTVSILYRIQDRWSEVQPFGTDPSSRRTLQLHPLMDEATAVPGDGVYKAEFTLKTDKFQDALYALQMKLIRADGTTRYTPAAAFKAEFSKGLASTAGKDDFMESEALKRKREGETKGGFGRTAVGDAFVTKLNVSPSLLVPDLYWSEDAKAVFALDEVGVLRRLKLPDFAPDGNVDLGEPCTGLHQSKEGLLAVRKSGGLVLIDERTLGIKSKIFLTKANSIAASKGTSLVFLSYGFDLKILDLSSGNVIRSQNGFKTFEEVYGPLGLYRGEVKLSQWNSIAVTHDGRFLICQSNGFINRLRISGNRVIFEEGSPRLMETWPIRLSPDSLYVSSNQNSTNAPAPQFPKLPGNGTGFYVLPIMNLQAPVVSVSTKGYPGPVGYDPKAGQLYAAGMGIFDSKGATRKEYTLPGSMKAAPQQILVHPEGYSYLLLGGDLVWVELPR